MSPQLEAQTLPPAAQVSRMMVSQWMAEAIRAAAELGVGDVLVERPMTSDEVARRLGSEPDHTRRLLLAIVALDLAVCNDDGTFELTEAGACLDRTSPLSIHAWVRLISSGLPAMGWSVLGDVVRQGKMASKLQDGRPDSETALWDELAADPQAAELFHRAMYEITRDAAIPVAAAIDLSANRRVIDVGGGAGGLLCAVLDAHEHMEGAVFDLPNAEASAVKLHAERGLADRAGFIGGSFFEDPLPPADVYMMKNVIHDWDDEHSHKILVQTRETASPGARIMIVEAPLPEERGNSFYDWFMAFADLNVMINNGGRERTEDEYRVLLERAGLELVDVRDAGLFSVFEARVRAV
jgi:hypothetical protein